MIISEIEAKEGRDVAIIVILDAYLHTYIDKYGNKKIIMLFKGKLAELSCTESTLRATAKVILC